MEHDLFIEIPWALERDTKPLDNEVKYPEALVRHFLKKYTKKGDKIFDPFAGLGTTLFTSEEMGRIPYGLEANRERFEWVAGQLEHWNNLKHGDSAKLLDFSFPKMDFCITGPPYMPRHHKWNPLYSGDPKKAGYDVYLKRMAYIFSNLKKLMKRNALVIVQADNLTHGKIYTPLLHDLLACVSKNFQPCGETMVRWKNAKPDYPSTTCMIFKNT